MNYTETDALISDDCLYRYVLTRGWGPVARPEDTVVFCMLNPSTVTKDGCPKHPLYLPARAERKDFTEGSR